MCFSLPILAIEDIIFLYRFFAIFIKFSQYFIILKEGGSNMPSAWMIGSLVIKSDLVVLIGSFIVGFLFFWFMSPTQKWKQKKVDRRGQ